MRKIDLDHCYVCGSPLPYGTGTAVYHARLRIRFCDKRPCRTIVIRSEKDWSKSKRGRLRGRRQALELIDRHAKEES